MPQVKFINHDGGIYEVDVQKGTSVMQAAVDNMIDGIVGECGGSCSCATCHCYVDEGWLDKLPKPGGYAGLGVPWELGQELPVGFTKKVIGFPRVANNCSVTFCAASRTVG